MNTLELSDDDLWRVINALHTAAETYEADANKVTTPRFRKQFRDQAEQAREFSRKLASI